MKNRFSAAIIAFLIICFPAVFFYAEPRITAKKIFLLFGVYLYGMHFIHAFLFDKSMYITGYAFEAKDNKFARVAFFIFGIGLSVSCLIYMFRVNPVA